MGRALQRSLAKGQGAAGLTGTEALKTPTSLTDATLCLLPPGAERPPLLPSPSWVCWPPCPQDGLHRPRFRASTTHPSTGSSNQVLPAVITGHFSRVSARPRALLQQVETGGALILWQSRDLNPNSVERLALTLSLGFPEAQKCLSPSLVTSRDRALTPHPEAA